MAAGVEFCSVTLMFLAVKPAIFGTFGTLETAAPPPLLRRTITRS
jgi:hypothetical protein